MIEHLTHRKAQIDDLRAIVTLLIEDDLGQTRECLGDDLDQRYIEAFHRIDADPNQYLMVVLLKEEVIGTCHLTLLPSLTFMGSTRLQIEAVRVAIPYRGDKIGAWMMAKAINYAKKMGASIVQLTTNTERPRARNFYEKLGFKITHEGMKLYL